MTAEETGPPPAPELPPMQPHPATAPAQAAPGLAGVARDIAGQLRQAATQVSRDHVSPDRAAQLRSKADAAAERAQALLVKTPGADRLGLAPAAAASVRVEAGPDHTTLSADDLARMLAVAETIAARPGAMPPKLIEQVAALAASLRAHAGSNLALPADQKPVVTFLRQQALARDGLAERLLHRCHTCRFEKIENPEFKKITKKQARTRQLNAGARMAAMGGSPLLAMGMGGKAPEFVCPRCQGLEADTTTVTFCANCGERHGDAVLRACGRCKHDPRAPHADQPAWSSAND